MERIILTASGGPFRTWTREQMANVTAATARAHPNWSMGLKISIGSASMFNKALEMIEAKHLFNVRPDQIEVIVHPQSVVHSMVGYTDGSVLAQLGCPDMRTAIGYALTYPSRSKLSVDRLDFAKLARLDFEAPDEVRFPALRLARTALERGGLQGGIMNAAEEIAFQAFVDGRIGFLEMADIAEAVMDQMIGSGSAETMDAVFAADQEARNRAAVLVKQKKKLRNPPAKRCKSQKQVTALTGTSANVFVTESLSTYSVDITNVALWIRHSMALHLETPLLESSPLSLASGRSRLVEDGCASAARLVQNPGHRAVCEHHAKSGKRRFSYRPQEAMRALQWLTPDAVFRSRCRSSFPRQQRNGQSR